MTLVVPLVASRLDAAADVIVQSFAADPGLLFVLPASADRERLGPSMARAMVRFVLRCGAPLATSPMVQGVGLWFPPDASAPSAEDLDEFGLSRLPAHIGPEASARFQRLMDRLDALHPQLAPEPHWYLAMLGVDPRAQRRGLGEALMRPVFDAADRDGATCYLELPTIENTRYYERRGFRVVAEVDIPGSDVHIWCMRREPGVR